MSEPKQKHNQSGPQLTEKFAEFRKLYPQMVKQTSMKADFLHKWIRQNYYETYRQIYIRQSKEKKSAKKQSKVLDQNDNEYQSDSGIERFLLESIKIVLKSQQSQGEEKCETFTSETVAILAQQVEAIYSVALRNQGTSNSKQNKDTQEKVHKKQSIKGSQTGEKLSLKEEVKQPDSKSADTLVKTSEKNVHKDHTPKNEILETKNSLMVQKEKPISEQNIFKELLHNSVQKKEKDRDTEVINFPQKNENEEKSIEPQIGQSEPPESEKESGSELCVENRTQIPHVESGLANVSDRSVQGLAGQQDLLSNGDKQQQASLEEQIPQKVIQQKHNAPPETLRKVEYRPPNLHLSKERCTPKQKSPLDSIMSNPFVKRAFSHICRQNYVGGGKTFDQIAQSSESMNVNKWMVFCKEFGFNQKLKNKVLIDVYQEATNFKSSMSKEEFQKALVIVQRRMNMEDEADFVRSYMGLDSELAFRQKVATFKVNYGAPRFDPYKEASKLPIDRFYERKHEEQYLRERLKQKEHILHQGKFKEQIDSELSQRKKLRSLKKGHDIGYSEFLPSISAKSSVKRREKSTSRTSHMSPYSRYVENKSLLTECQQQSQRNNSKLSSVLKRMQPMTYSNIFQQKSNEKSFLPMIDKNSRPSNVSTNVGANSDRPQVSRSKGMFSLKKFSPAQASTAEKQSQQFSSTNSKPPQKGSISEADRVVKEIDFTKQQILEKINNPEEKPTRQWSETVQRWEEQFERADSEESDQILKEHLTNQRSMKMPEPMQLSRMIKAYDEEPEWLRQGDGEEQSYEDDIANRKTELRFN